MKLIVLTIFFCFGVCTSLKIECKSENLKLLRELESLEKELKTSDPISHYHLQKFMSKLSTNLTNLRLKFKTSVHESHFKDGVLDCCDGSDENSSNDESDCLKVKEFVSKAVDEQIQSHREGKKKAIKLTKKSNPPSNSIDQKKSKLEQYIQKKASIQTLSNRERKELNDLYKAFRFLFMEKKLPAKDLNRNEVDFSPLLAENSAISCHSIDLNEKTFKGGSFEPIAGNYRFTFCPFISISQLHLDNEKSEPSLLGIYSKWDNKIPFEQQFKNGDQCWNGPERVVTLQMVCGIEDKLIHFHEDGKCVYHAQFQTPLVCSRKFSTLLEDLISVNLNSNQQKQEL